MIANRYEILLLASLSGIVYAVLRLSVLVCLPALAGQIWQRLLGPMLMSRWPSLAQSDDEQRPSYLPTRPGQPFVVILGPPADPLAEVGDAYRDGFVLGVLLITMPELFASSLLLTMLLATVLARTAWAIPRAAGAERTDLAYLALRDVLLCIGAVWAARTAGLLTFTGAIGQ